MAASTVPAPLIEGDCLTAGEFLLRWDAMPDVKQAELIGGIVFMPSPVTLRHSRPHSVLSGWLLQYAAATPGCDPGTEGTWLMGEQDVPQPDATLRILPEYGGQSRDEGEYASGAPELIVEVAASSYSRDLGVKKRLYERVGVREYVIALAAQREVLWHELTAGGFQTLAGDGDGILRSRCFPGLWLDPAALWESDLPRVVRVLQQGLATPEHAEFVVQLSARRR